MIYNDFARKNNKSVITNFDSKIYCETREELGALFTAHILQLKQDNNKPYSAGSRMNYFRGWLASLSSKQKFRTAVVEARNTWFPEVAKKLEMRASVNTIRRREPISKRRKPICRALHKWIKSTH